MTHSTKQIFHILEKNTVSSGFNNSLLPFAMLHMDSHSLCR